MTKQVLDLLKSLLEKDIRAKNAACVLFGLLCVVVFYVTSRHSALFREIRTCGGLAVPIALMLVFLAGFLVMCLIWSGVSTYRRRLVSRLATRQKVQQEMEVVRSNVEGLTDWQRGFLRRYIHEAKTQIPEFEVGGYRAVWDDEMRVLINKGMIIEHRNAGMYEIAPRYLTYLRSRMEDPCLPRQTPRAFSDET